MAAFNCSSLDNSGSDDEVVVIGTACGTGTLGTGGGTGTPIGGGGTAPLGGGGTALVGGAGTLLGGAGTFGGAGTLGGAGTPLGGGGTEPLGGGGTLLGGAGTALLGAGGTVVFEVFTFDTVLGVTTVVLTCCGFVVFDFDIVFDGVVFLGVDVFVFVNCTCCIVSSSSSF